MIFRELHRGCSSARRVECSSRKHPKGAQARRVKNANEAILEAILKKHGGLEATCIFSDAALRTSLLYRIAGLGMFSRETIEGAQGYKVKNINDAILEAVLKKHGGIEATCIFSDAALRTSLLYVVYEHLY
ncbi:hypothetical protein Tco_1013375 [Tanacetum coccineum]